MEWVFFSDFNIKKKFWMNCAYSGVFQHIKIFSVGLNIFYTVIRLTHPSDISSAKKISTFKYTKRLLKCAFGNLVWTKINQIYHKKY